jgi:hypothetical protein
MATKITRLRIVLFVYTLRSSTHVAEGVGCRLGCKGVGLDLAWLCTTFALAKVTYTACMKFYWPLLAKVL